MYVKDPFIDGLSSRDTGRDEDDDMRMTPSPTPSDEPRGSRSGRYKLYFEEYEGTFIMGYVMHS